MHLSGRIRKYLRKFWWGKVVHSPAALEFALNFMCQVETEEVRNSSGHALKEYAEPELKSQISQQIEDEMKHSVLLANCVRAVGGRPIALTMNFRSYDNIENHLGVHPLLHFLLFCYSVEKIALESIRDCRDVMPPGFLKDTIGQIVDDEERHVAYLQGAVRSFEESSYLPDLLALYERETWTNYTHNVAVMSTELAKRVPTPFFRFFGFAALLYVKMASFISFFRMIITTPRMRL